MSVIERIRERIRERKRRKKIKDLCSCCRWYYPESGVCQIKKCSGNGGYGYVTKRDRKRCDNFDRKPIGKVVEKNVSEDGLTLTAKLTTHGEDAVDALRYAVGYKDALEDGIRFWADNELYESMTMNDVREAAGLPRIKEEDEIRPKRCAYCGCSTEKVTGTCDHCGAPL